MKTRTLDILAWAAFTTAVFYTAPTWDYPTLLACAIVIVGVRTVARVFTYD